MKLPVIALNAACHGLVLVLSYISYIFTAVRSSSGFKIGNMAIVQYTAVVNQLRGKLNGSVFSKTRSAYTLQRKPMQSRAFKGFQPEIRQVFANVQRRWKLLTAGQHAAWALAAQNNPSTDRFGQQVSLSGYNQFIKANILADYVDGSTVDNPYTAPAPPNVVNSNDITGVSFSQSGQGTTEISLTWNLDVQVNDSAYAAILDVSLPIGSGVTAYYGRFTHIMSARLTFDPALSGTVDLGPAYPPPFSNQYVLFRVRVLLVPAGAVVGEYFLPVTL